MAECMDDELFNARLEQEDELTVLQSIFEDNFHLLSNSNVNGGEGEGSGDITELSLSIKIHSPFEKVLVEAVIPVEVDEPILITTPGSDPEEQNHNFDEPLDSQVVNDGLDEMNGEIDETKEEGAAAMPDSPIPAKKPGLMRLLSTRHWHIQSEVRELTPINLWCQFPPLYPARDMPKFSLSCYWLSKEELMALADQLEVIWQENVNMPIIYMWADWLQNSTWEFLNLQSHIILRENIMEESPIENSSYTIPDSLPLDMALLAIFEHDIKAKKEEFMKEKHACEVCFEEKNGAEFCYLDECGHFCCMECMRYHCEMHVESGTVLRLMCPNHECKVTIPPQILQEVLEEEKFIRWERLLLSKTLDMMQDIFYCPRCHAAVVADEEESSRLAQCAVCFYAFCTDCGDPWHYGKSCLGEEEEDEKKEEKKKKRKKKKKKNDEEYDEDEPKYGHKRSMSSKHFIAAMKKRGLYRPCPKCRMIVEKNMGCNMMTCAQCNGQFCWSCGKPVSSYSHFHNTPCGLMVTARILPPPQEPSQGELLIQDFKEKNPDKPVHTKCCIRCGQKNLKTHNNNYLKCWSCKTPFCYQCGKMLEGGYRHFTPPNPCKQHSDD